MKRLAKILGALALVLAAAALGLWLLLPAERIARLAADRAQAVLGRPVAIEGGVSVRLAPRPGATLRQVSLGNAPGGEAPHLIRAEAIHLGVSLIPLLSGRIEIARLEVEAPVIALEIAPDGVPNWVFARAQPQIQPRPGPAPAPAAPSAPDAAAPPSGPPSASAPGAPPPAAPPAAASPAPDAPAPSRPAPAPRRAPDISLPLATLSDAVVTFHDRRTGRRERVEALDLALGAPVLSGPLAVEAEGAWRDVPLRLSATADSAFGLIAGASADAVVSASLGGLEIDWTGPVRLPSARRARPQADGRLGLAAADPAAALARFGLAPPPWAGALTDLALQADIALAPAGLSVAATLTGTRNGAPLAGTLRLTGAPDWRRARSADLDLSLEQAGLAQARWSGRAGLSARGAPRLDGTLAAAAGRPALLLEKLGLPAPPPMRDLRDARLQARIDLSPRGLAIDADGAAALPGLGAPLLGSLALRGDADWAAARRLQATARGEAAGLLSAAFEGRLSAPPGQRASAAGDLRAEAADLRALLRLLGAPPPDTLRRGALRSAAIDARISATRRDISLRAGTYRLDAMEASGALDLALSGRPALEGRLTAGPLDLRPYLGRRRAAAGDAPAPDGWSRAPLDLSALKAFDARLAVSAPSVVLPDLALGEVDARLVLRDGDLTARLRRAEAFGGVLRGRLSAGGAARRPTLAADLTAEGLSLGPLLAALAGVDLIEGRGAFDIDLAGTGRSLHAVMNDLSGDAALRLSDGALTGVDLAALARTLGSGLPDAAAGAARRTAFTAVEASFSAAEGRLRTEDFSLVGPLLRITGAGVVDLGGRRLDVDLAPRAVASLKGQGDRRARPGLLIPLTVRGPWGALDILPDLAAAAAAGLVPAGGEGAVEALRGLADGDLPGALDGAAEAVRDGLIPGLAPPAGSPDADSDADADAGADSDAGADAETASPSDAARKARRKAERQAERDARRKARRQAERKARRAQEAQTE